MLSDVFDGCLSHSYNEAMRSFMSNLGFKLILCILNPHCYHVTSVVWKLCAESSEGFRATDSYSTEHSSRGTCGDVIVFNLIRSNQQWQTAEVSMLNVMLSWYMYEERQRKFSRLNKKEKKESEKSCYCPFFLFHTVSLRAKRLEDFKEVHNLL